MHLEQHWHRTVPVAARIHLAYCFIERSQSVSLELSVTMIASICLFIGLFIHEKTR